jgi:uncharacterized protein YrzB (UPF0473 family)
MGNTPSDAVQQLIQQDYKDTRTPSVIYTGDVWCFLAYERKGETPVLRLCVDTTEKVSLLDKWRNANVQIQRVQYKEREQQLIVTDSKGATIYFEIIKEIGSFAHRLQKKLVVTYRAKHTEKEVQTKHVIRTTVPLADDADWNLIAKFFARAFS